MHWLLVVMSIHRLRFLPLVIVVSTRQSTEVYKSLQGSPRGLLQAVAVRTIKLPSICAEIRILSHKPGATTLFSRNCLEFRQRKVSATKRAGWCSHFVRCGHQSLSVTKDISGVTLARVAFDSVGALTTIMMRFFQFCLLRQQVLGSHVTRTR